MSNARHYDWDDPDLLIGDDAKTSGLIITPSFLSLRQELDERLAQENFDVIYKGTQAASLGKLVRKIGQARCYSFDFHFWIVGSPKSTDATERIAYWMSANFPGSPDQLQLSTTDLIKMWVSYKDYVIRIAQIFRENGGKKLATELKTGLIDKMEYDLIWAQGKLWRNFWELIQKRWSIISRYLNQNYNCPFTTPEQLFQEIIATDFNGGFGKLLQSRYAQNYKELKKLALLSKQELKGFGCLEESEIKKLDWFKKQYITRNLWFENVAIVLPVIIEKTDDPILKAHIQVHNSWVDAVCKLYIKACSDPKNQVIYNVTWIEGHEYRGIVYKTAGGELKKARGEIKPASVNKN